MRKAKITQDLPADQIEVDLDQAKEFFAELKVPVLETSAKVNYFVI